VRKKSLKLKELPPQLRPREKLFGKGVRALSDVELLALLMGTGNPHGPDSVLDLGYRVLVFLRSSDDDDILLRRLLEINAEQLCDIPGIGKAKAATMIAAAELGRRIAGEVSQCVQITNPEDAARLLMADMRYLDREHFKAVMLNTKNQVIGVELISIGSLDSSVAHPREIFKECIKRSAAAVILAHNHPSGDPAPSDEDVMLTTRLINAGSMLGISVLDHIIIGDNCYVSLREHGQSWQEASKN